MKLNPEELNKKPIDKMGKQTVDEKGEVKKRGVGRPKIQTPMVVRNLSLDKNDYDFLRDWCHSKSRNLSKVMRELMALKVEEIKAG